MPRLPSTEMRTEWKISLPATLAAAVEFLLLDAGSMKSRYGARSALLTDLLRKWVAEQDISLETSDLEGTSSDADH